MGLKYIVMIGIATVALTWIAVCLPYEAYSQDNTDNEDLIAEFMELNAIPAAERTVSQWERMIDIIFEVYGSHDVSGLVESLTKQIELYDSLVLKLRDSIAAVNELYAMQLELYEVQQSFEMPSSVGFNLVDVGVSVWLRPDIFDVDLYAVYNVNSTFGLGVFGNYRGGVIGWGLLCIVRFL